MNGLAAPSRAPVAATDQFETNTLSLSGPDVTEEEAAPPNNQKSDKTQVDPPRASSLVALGEQALLRDDPVAARSHFSEALGLDVEEPVTSRLRAELRRLGNETIFSSRLFQSDPLVGRYVVKPGDTLAKIAAANKVSDDLLATVNGIANKHLIRAGQTIKLIKGPFHAVVDTKSYSLDVYLGQTFVKHYQVGLGADGSTPSGQWEVGTKLVNPTYYPPRGGLIIAADDPDNPLGERWISLVGVSGQALGQYRYGIHGTVEPETIGRSSSLGCIRMHNQDVEALYTYLVEKHSMVTVK